MVVGIAATGDMALIKCGSAGWGDQAGPHPLAQLIIVPECGGTLARAVFIDRAIGAAAATVEVILCSPFQAAAAEISGLSFKLFSVAAAGQGRRPAGSITHEDLDAFAACDLHVVRSQALQPKSAVEDVKVIGLQRRIAEQMAVAHARIPPIAEPAKAQGAAEAHVAAVHDARDGVGDRESAAAEHAVRRRGGVIHQHAGIHIGVAAQTSAGLLVPVVRHVESLDLWDCTVEVARLAEAARIGTTTREELSGSTITITSLGTALARVVPTIRAVRSTDVLATLELRSAASSNSARAASSQDRAPAAAPRCPGDVRMPCVRPQPMRL
jgi:pyruvate/2-oxoglutarate dehydrogenase complex dihydrolipoamide acyltransferase (E2) component